MESRAEYADIPYWQHPGTRNENDVEVVIATVAEVSTQSLCLNCVKVWFVGEGEEVGWITPSATRKPIRLVWPPGVEGGALAVDVRKALLYSGVFDVSDSFDSPRDWCWN